MTTQHWIEKLTEVLQDKKGENIQHFPVKSFFADHFIVVSALSSRHLWTLCEAIEKACKAEGFKAMSHGKKVPQKKGAPPAEVRWIVVDAGGVLVHLFSPEGRSYYNLEELWQEQNSKKEEVDILA